MEMTSGRGPSHLEPHKPRHLSISMAQAKKQNNNNNNKTHQWKWRRDAAPPT